MSFGIYILGFLILIAGLIYGAVMLKISGQWIAVGAIVLFGLAIRQQGRLVTFDRRILGLLPPDSVLRDGLAIIPA